MSKDTTNPETRIALFQSKEIHRVIHNNNRVKTLTMPRACPVGGSRWVLHKAEYGTRDATGLPRGGSRWLLTAKYACRQTSSLRESPRGKPVASGESQCDCCSSHREPPPGKLVASSGSSHGLNNEWWFIAKDGVLALIDSRDTKQYIQRMKQRDAELEKGWVQVVHTLSEAFKGWGQIAIPLGLHFDSPGGRQAMLCAIKAAFTEYK